MEILEITRFLEAAKLLKILLSAFSGIVLSLVSSISALQRKPRFFCEKNLCFVRDNWTIKNWTPINRKVFN